MPAAAAGEFVRALRQAMSDLQADPDLLHSPEYGFFREYLQSLGATLPPLAAGGDGADREDPEIWGGDDSAAYAEVVPIAAPTRVDADKAADLKAAAHDAMPDVAVALMTKALAVKPSSSMYWAARARYYLDWKKPRCAIRDAERALELNSDSAKALRVRGLAYRHLGKWEEAARDLAAANQTDYDASTDAVTKLVTDKAASIRIARSRDAAVGGLDQRSDSNPRPPATSADPPPPQQQSPRTAFGRAGGGAPAVAATAFSMPECDVD